MDRENNQEEPEVSVQNAGNGVESDGSEGGLICLSWLHNYITEYFK